MSKAMKRCPFCGSVSAVTAYVKNGAGGHDLSKYSVVCPGCLCRGPKSEYKDKAEELWEGRATAIPLLGTIS
jgi:hypothetical protein